MEELGLVHDEPSVVCAARLARQRGATELVFYCLDSFYGDNRTWTPDGPKDLELPGEDGYDTFRMTLMVEVDPNGTGIPWRFAR
jgi:hypothetical protein